MSAFVTFLRCGAYAAVALICLNGIRRYWLTLSRLMARHANPYAGIDSADWPHVTALIPAHNERLALPRLLDALLEVTYPRDRLRLLPINDRSDDRTGSILDRYAARHGDRITPFHRKTGKPGKAAALADATGLIQDEIILVVDANHIPGTDVIRQLVAPFFDPRVGAVMGHVAPRSVERGFFARLVDLEHLNMRLVPLCAGTIAAVRKTALASIGGWNADAACAHTDAAFRLALGGWQVVHENLAGSFEEAPTGWAARALQLQRRTRSHLQSLLRYGARLMLRRNATLAERLGSFFLMSEALTPVALPGAWILLVALFFVDAHLPRALFPALALGTWVSAGNIAACFEAGAAARLARGSREILLMPLTFFGGAVNLTATVAATISPFPKPSSEHATVGETPPSAQRRTK